MKKKQRQFPVLLAAAAVALAAVPAVAQDGGAASKPLVLQWLDGDTAYDGPEITYDGPPIEVRFSTFIAPTGSVATVIIEKAFERLKQDTNGKIVIRPYWSNSLADAQRGGFEAVASGVAQMSHCYVAFNPAGFDLHVGLQIPFLVNRSTAASLAIQEIYEKYFRETYEQKDVYLARAGITPPNQLLTTGKPVERLEDLAGKKTWALGEIPNAVLSALGATPVALPPSELYVSMQSGVVDITPMHDAGTRLFRLGELAKARTAANLTASTTEYCMNKEFFDGLPADLQQAFYLWLQRWNHAESELYYDTEAALARKEMQEAGVVFVDLPPEETQRWKDRVEPVIERWIAANEAKGLPARQFYDEYVELIAKYETLSDDELFEHIVASPVPGLVSGYTLSR